MSPRSCLGLVRGFLFLINLLVFALGTLLLAFGLWVLIDRHSFAAMMGSPLSGLRLWAQALAGGGAAAMGLALLGGLGALRGVKGLLLLYFGVLLLLFAAQIALGVVVYTQRGTLAAAAAAAAQELIGGYPAQGPPTAPQELWDALQQQLGCCGWNGPQDWAPPHGVACSCLPPPHNRTHGDPPTALPHGRCPTAAPDDVFPMGCAEAVWGWLAENMVAIVGGCLGIGLMELFLLLLAMFLLRNPRPPRAKLF